MKKINEKNDQLDRKYVNILGINVISTSFNEVLTGINDFITHNRKFSVVTPNPELVVMSLENMDLKSALNKADFPVPDGHGLSLASRILYGRGLEIIPGRKLFDELIQAAVRKNWKVFLLGGMDNEADASVRKLKYKYGKLRIMSARGPKLDNAGQPVSVVDKKIQKDTMDGINKYAPHILFVAFGNPKQEIWIQKNINGLNIGGAMAVGGTFRYIAGLSKLPPAWMEGMGLEWLWRVLTEPVRLRRIWNAVIVFPWRVLIFKLSKK